MNTNTAYIQNYDWKENQSDKEIMVCPSGTAAFLSALSETVLELLYSLKLRIASVLIRYPKLTLYCVATTCILTVFCIFFLRTSLVNAQSDHASTKYFTVIEVEAGDTLWGIAKEYRTSEYASLQEYIKEVREINHISGDEITSGCFLTIPYFAEEPLVKE